LSGRLTRFWSLLLVKVDIFCEGDLWSMGVFGFNFVIAVFLVHPREKGGVQIVGHWEARRGDGRCWNVVVGDLFVVGGK
jgi:hypothetical protein